MKIHLIFSITFLVLLFSCKNENSTANQSDTDTKEGETVAPSVGGGEDALHIGSADSWDVFWANFQNALNTRDIEKIKSSVLFPFAGSEFVNNGQALKKEEFAGKFDELFNKSVIDLFSKKSVEDMHTFKVSSKSQVHNLNVTTGTEIKSLTVYYTLNEGLENENIVSVSYFFGYYVGRYRLVSVMLQD